MAKRRRRKIWRNVFLVLLLLILGFILYFRIVTCIDPPTEMQPREMGYERNVQEELITSGRNFLHRNDHGLWEMYLEGPPLELGIVNGLLSEELVIQQEDAFVKQINVMVPSSGYLKFLKYFLAWFNKDLDEYIPQEYLLEIYGVSAFASEDYGWIGDKYDRILNYHAAHDIGHALQNMDLVKCTAFGVWDDQSSDSSILIGRNFDFHVGDEFAENKIIAFVAPEEGHRFASVTWAGMIGVVSGMNEKGLTVSLNSAKSDIPFGARTPVSIIAREILQYASNIDEALAIASRRESFVSESFLIGSAADHKVVVIEKSTDTTLLYDPDTNSIILTNHFQSEYFMNDALNIENMANETSVYRHQRVAELLDQDAPLDVNDAAAIMRDRRGLKNENIGNGNEKAINQLIAHHSIIFKPEEGRFWISTAPYQLGEYLCYDLDSVFDNAIPYGGKKEIYLEDLSIPADTFLSKDGYHHFVAWKGLGAAFLEAAEKEERIENEQATLDAFIAYNPEYYYTYDILGQYFYAVKDFGPAVKYFTFALEKEVSSATERERIQERSAQSHEEEESHSGN